MSEMRNFRFPIVTVLALGLLAGGGCGPASRHNAVAQPDAAEARARGNGSAADVGRLPAVVKSEALSARSGPLIASAHVIVERMGSTDRLLTLSKPEGGYVPRTAIRELSLRVNEREIDVPVDAVISIYDPNRFRLRAQNGAFVLEIDASDASNAYGVRIWFNDKYVYKREEFFMAAPEIVDVVNYRTEDIVIE